MENLSKFKDLGYYLLIKEIDRCRVINGNSYDYVFDKTRKLVKLSKLDISDDEIKELIDIANEERMVWVRSAFSSHEKDFEHKEKEGK
jgi:hypothetical protein